MRSEKELKRVNRLLSLWFTQLETDIANGFTDKHRVSEGIACQLLNLVYGLNLSVLEHESRDMPGIDLGDKDAGIAFQVTSRTDNRKIKENLETFDRLHRETYPRGIRFFILNKAKPTAATIDPTGYPYFDPDKDIISYRECCREISRLQDEDPQRFAEVRELLEHELGGETKKGFTPALKAIFGVVMVAVILVTAVLIRQSATPAMTKADYEVLLKETIEKFPAICYKRRDD